MWECGGLGEKAGVKGWGSGRAGAQRGGREAHSAAQPERALLTYPNAASSARQVKSVFREGTRQETGLHRGKEQRKDHLVGSAAVSLQMVPAKGRSEEARMPA